jgi:DNA-binding XRE family transcriptional regulator
MISRICSRGTMPRNSRDSAESAVVLGCGKSTGLTQTDLARRTGIRPETLSRLKKGKSTPDVETVDKIIRVLERVEAKVSP